jgi:hypothetical protein
MATKLLQIEVLESNCFIELEVEETMLLKVVIAKLQSAGHLASDKDYYIKNPDGTVVWEDNAVKFCKESRMIFTIEKDWKPELVFSGGFSDAEEINDGVVLNEGTYWMLPFLDGVLWNDHGGGCRFFLLENILLYDGNSISIRLLVQYSQPGIPGTNGINSAEQANRMQQVLTNIFNNEMSVNHLTVNTLYDKIEELPDKMKRFLSMYTEQNWHTKVDSVSILGIDLGM